MGGLRSAIFELRLKETLSRSFVSSLENLVDLNRRMARKRYTLELVVEDGFPSRVPAVGRRPALDATAGAGAGGELEIESEPGGGTRVRFRVPITRLVQG